MSTIPLGMLASVIPKELIGELNQPTAVRALTESMTGARGHARRALFIDDAHLLDNESAALVSELATARQLFILLITNHENSLPHALKVLRDGPLLEIIDVPPLTPSLLTEALSQVLGGLVDPAVSPKLLAISDDDLVVFRELARGAFDSGKLRNEGGIWRLDAQVSLPWTVVDLVQRELGELDPTEHSVLEMVALGEPLGSAELALADPAAISALQRRALITRGMSGRRVEIRVARRLHAAVLRTRLPTVARLSLARRLIDLAEANGAGRKDDVLRRAMWQLEGDTTDPDLLIAAASDARAKGDFGIAEELANAAARLGGVFRARLFVAQLMDQRGRNDRTEADLTALAAEAKTDSERGQLAVIHITYLVYKVGDFKRGQDIANAALDEIEDPAWRGEIIALMAGMAMWTDGAKVALATVAPLLDSSESRAFVTASLIGSAVLGRLGRLTEAVELASHGYAIHQSLDQPLTFHPTIHLLYQYDALESSGRFGDAANLARNTYEEALVKGDAESQAFVALHGVRSISDRGNVATAIRYARESGAAFCGLGRPRFAMASLIYLATALALNGETEAAEAALTGEDAPDSSFANEADLYLAWAWIAASSGNLPRARGFVEQAVEAARRVDHVVGESVSWHTYARFGKASSAVPHLNRLAAIIDGDLSSARARHAVAMNNGDAEALDLSSATFGEMGANLLAAEAAADAAIQWWRQGNAHRAMVSERMTRVLLTRCEGPRTPGLQAVGTRARLTSAERDAALLAARGHSSREIANSLGLSIRTIENQIQHAYAKLGVSSRAELKIALGSPD